MIIIYHSAMQIVQQINTTIGLKSGTVLEHIHRAKVNTFCKQNLTVRVLCFRCRDIQVTRYMADTSNAA